MSADGYDEATVDRLRSEGWRIVKLSPSGWIDATPPTTKFTITAELLGVKAPPVIADVSATSKETDSSDSENVEPA